MDWINRNLGSIAITFVVIAVLWVLFGPLLLTKTGICLADFSGGTGNTGVVGDTIGGITSPVIGLISITLLFLALIKQIESNDRQRESNDRQRESNEITVTVTNFNIIGDEINSVKNLSKEFKFGKVSGIDAIQEFVVHIGSKLVGGNFTQSNYQELEVFDRLLTNFNKVLFLLDNLKTTEVYKDILTRDLQNIFRIYYQTTIGVMHATWLVSHDDVHTSLERGKAYMVMLNIESLAKNINSRKLLDYSVASK
jgi:uncharacterized membrane protein